MLNAVESKSKASPSFAMPLRKTNKVGLGLAVIGGREWLVAVAPLEDGLMMEMLRYADELRDPAEYFDEVPSAENPRHLVRRTMARRSRNSSARR